MYFFTLSRGLIGQLARRRQDQRPHRMARWRHAGARVRQQFLNDRQREAGCLAGAGLRRTHYVETFITTGIAFA